MDADAALVDSFAKRFDRNPGNRFSHNEAVKELVRFASCMTVEEFAQLRSAIAPLVSHLVETDAERMFAPLPDRLFRLSHRLEQDGFYVDADIVWQAREALTKAAA